MSKWHVECWNCHGERFLYSCFDEGACLDPESGCDLCEQRCDICNGKGQFIVTELTEDNCDTAVPVDD